MQFEEKKLIELIEGQFAADLNVFELLTLYISLEKSTFLLGPQEDEGDIKGISMTVEGN